LRNIARDRSTNRRLRKAGWRVLRLWAHTLRFSAEVARRITSELKTAAEQCRCGAGKSKARDRR
jgi:G:T-mismatch repair DNA endonuclease (very short patch repair protein)